MYLSVYDYKPGIVFIPGSYASVVIFGTWSGWRGYDYNQIANYDEDDII